jgi:V/A-type H+-transporting ATPase subunit A
VQLVGSDALPEDQQMTLEIARMVREYFLQQDAFHEVDTFCPLEKQYMMVNLILSFSDKAYRAIELNKRVDEILNLPSRPMIARMKYEHDYKDYAKRVSSQIDQDFNELFGGEEE